MNTDMKGLRLHAVADLVEGPGFQSHSKAKLRHKGPRRIIFEAEPPLFLGIG